jgi:hypothetical protein
MIAGMSLATSRAMWFNGWSPIGRTLVIGFIAYVAVVVLLRIGGKRTLANMDEFDLVVLVAMGNLFATAMLAPDVSLVQALAGLALLAMLQSLFANQPHHRERTAASCVPGTASPRPDTKGADDRRRDPPSHTAARGGRHRRRRRRGDGDERRVQRHPSSVSPPQR